MSKLLVKVADITREDVCAVVNAANSTLLGGGVVDGAIHRAGGAPLEQECLALRESRYPHGLPTGQAVATGAGKMGARYVIHTVGPVYGSCADSCAELLAAAYTNSLAEALKVGCQSIAFPAISTGIYRYPKEEAARIAFLAVTDFLSRTPDIEVRFVFHSQTDASLFLAAIKASPAAKERKPYYDHLFSRDT